MAVMVSTLPDEPIIVATFTGELAIEDFRQWAVELAKASKALESYYVFHLMDIRDSHTEFKHIMNQFKEGARKWNVLRTDALEGKHLQGLMVGEHALAKLSTSLAKQPQFGGVVIPHFRTSEEAIAYARHELQTKLNDEAS